MKIGEAFPSKYLKADVDVPEEENLIAVMKFVEMKNVGMPDKPEMKPVLYFQGEEKGLVLNKTNANTISKLYGDDTDKWKGQSVALYSTDVEYQGKITRGIRVKSKAPKSNPVPAGAANGDADIPY